MLDYEKPLKDQPQIIDLLKQSKNKDVIKMLSNLDSFAGSKTPPTGQNLLKTLGYYPDNPEKASKTLNALGITGVKYLDAGSRPTNVIDKRLEDLYQKHSGDIEKAADDFMRTIHNTPKKKAAIREETIKAFQNRPTSNYVVFDPTDVKILERNNQPISRKELLQEQIDKIAK
jgi:hypothetical protein